MKVTQYKRKLAGIVKRAANVSEDVQECLVIAIQHLLKHGDAVFLTLCRNAVAETRGLSIKKFEGTVKDNVKGVRWGTRGDDTEGYMLSKGKDNVSCDVDALPNWFDYDLGTKKAAKPFDLEKGIARLAKRAVSEGQATSIDQFRRQVDAIMADTEFAAIFADAGVEVETAERKAA